MGALVRGGMVDEKEERRSWPGNCDCDGAKFWSLLRPFPAMDLRFFAIFFGRVAGKEMAEPRWTNAASQKFAQDAIELAHPGVARSERVGRLGAAAVGGGE